MTLSASSAKPTVKPARAHFSSGPCAKRPGWSFKALEGAFLGRSHRAKEGKAKLKLAIEKTKTILGVPAGFHCAVVPASDTGAYEMAMWTMLGQRPVLGVEVPCVQALACGFTIAHRRCNRSQTFWRYLQLQFKFCHSIFLLMRLCR